MSSTTVLTQVYADRDFETAAAKWLTYASIPAADLVALGLTGALCEALHYLFFRHFSLEDSVRFAPCLLIFHAVFYIAGVYPGFPINPIEEFRLSLRAVSLGFLIIIGGSFLMGNSHPASRLFLILGWFLACLLVPLNRHLVRLWCSRQSWWGIPTVILGELDLGSRMLSVLQSNRQAGLRPVALLVDSSLPNCAPVHTSEDVYCGVLSHAAFFARKYPNSYAIMATPLAGSEGVRSAFAEHAHAYSRVLVIPDLCGFTNLAVRARDLDGVLGLEIDHNLTKAYAQIFKRLFDIAVCFVFGTIVLPIFLLVALAVRASSVGPIFYRQRRIGRDGKEFGIWKFRTMVVDADAVLEKHLHADPALRDEWIRDRKLRKDPRITIIGRLLRRTSLDELPQLWNIFCGEMSLVGPRPIRQLEVEKYGSIFDQYRRVTPGLTGMWQISGRNDTTYEKRTELDDYYVRNWSISLDFYILLRTVKTILLAEGAY